MEGTVEIFIILILRLQSQHCTRLGILFLKKRKDVFIEFRERGREREGEWEKHQCERETLISCLPYAARGWTHHLGVCPDQAPQHFGVRHNTPTDWATPATARLGFFSIFFHLDISVDLFLYTYLFLYLQLCLRHSEGLLHPRPVSPLWKPWIILTHCISSSSTKVLLALYWDELLIELFPWCGINKHFLDSWQELPPNPKLAEPLAERLKIKEEVDVRSYIP